MLTALSAYRDISVKVIIAVTGISGFVLNKYFDWTTRLSGIEDVLLYGGVTALALATEVLVTSLPSKSRRLRTALLGNKNIEGVWIEISRKKTARTKIYSIGYCFIRIENDVFVLDGHAFRIDNKRQDNWKSTLTVLYPDGDFDILYKLPSSKTGTGDISGYCKYSFTINSDNVQPEHYTGSWVYPLDHETYFCEGRRVSDEDAAAIQIGFQGNFERCKALCQKYFPNTPLTS